MRRVMLTAAAAGAVAFGMLIPLGPDEARADLPPGATYVALTPTRIVDTQTGTGGSTLPFQSTEMRDYKVLGVAGIPANDVTAVVLDVAASSSDNDVSSSITVWPTGETRPTISNLKFNKSNSPRSNTVIVKPGASGSVSVWANGGVTGVNLDVQGYFSTSASTPGSGGYVPLDAPTRAMSTVTGTGTTVGRLQPSTSRNVQITGVNDVPAGAVAVFANVEARDATGDGSLKALPQGLAPTNAATAMDYSSSAPNVSGMTLKLSSPGGLTVHNTSTSASANVNIDIQGYFIAGGSTGGLYVPTTLSRAWDSRASGDLRPNQTVQVKVAGANGIPDSDTLSTVSVTLLAALWTETGDLVAWNPDDEQPPLTTNVSFTKGAGTPASGSETTSFVEVSHDGYIALTNRSAGTLQVFVNTQGWFSLQHPTVTTPDETSFGSADGRYTPTPKFIESATASRVVPFTNPLPASLTASSSANAEGGLNVTNTGGSSGGVLDAIVIDSSDAPVPSTLTKTSTGFSVTASPQSTATYPIRVILLYTSPDQVGMN